MKNTIRSASLLARAGVDATKAYLPARVLEWVLSIASMVVFTRMLDPSMYGLYFFISRLAGMFQSVGLGWIHAVILRYWREYTSNDSPAARDGFLTVLGSITLITLGISVCIWFVLSPWLLSEADTTTILIGAVMFMTAGLAEQVRRRARAVRALGRFVIYTLAPRLFTLGVGAFVLTMGYQTAGALILVAVVANALVAGADAHTNGTDYLPRKFNFDRGQLRRFLYYGIPITLTGLAGIARTQVDLLLVAKVYGTSAIAVYGVAWSLGTKLANLSSIIGGAAFPHLIEDHGTLSTQRMGASFSYFVTAFLIVWTPMIVGMGVIAEPLCGILFDDRYVGTEIYLIALLPGVFALGILRIISKPFHLAEKTDVQMKLAFAAAIVNVGLNLWGLFTFGPIGAALATSTTLLLQAGVTHIIASRYVSYRLEWARIAWTCVAVITMAGLVLAAQTGLTSDIAKLAASIPIGVITYGIFMAVLFPEGVRRVVSFARQRAARS